MIVEPPEVFPIKVEPYWNVKRSVYLEITVCVTIKVEPYWNVKVQQG